MADTDTPEAAAATPAPFVPPEPPTWEPDPTKTYSTRGYMAEDGTQRLYTIEKEAELFPPPALKTLLAGKLATIGATYLAKIAAGFPTHDLVVEIDDGSRADLGGMALTAALVKMGAQAWPEGMARGWITRGGTRIPLRTPDDGLALANGAASYYSALAQHEQDLADAAKAAADEAALAAVDESAGWPAG